MAERISFTRPSAERIARAVRAVENARPAGEPLRSRPVAEPARPAAFKFAAFEGTSAWRIGTQKTVTLLQKSPDTAVNPIGVFTFGSTNTALVHSCLFSIPGNVSTATHFTTLVAITKINGAWQVISSVAN